MRSKRIHTMVRCSVSASLMALCAWLAVPLPPVSVTLQTFAVFLALGLLGGKRGTAAIVLYLLLGLAGLPVFTGFRGGPSALLDATGGFLWGFAAAGLVYWLAEKLGTLPAMALGLAACYFCGCAWFTVWAPGAGWKGAVLACVVPCLIPDILKIALACSLSRRLHPRIYTDS